MRGEHLESVTNSKAVINLEKQAWFPNKYSYQLAHLQLHLGDRRFLKYFYNTFKEIKTFQKYLNPCS